MSSSKPWCLLERHNANRLSLRADSIDLVFCSPPYEAQRTYDIGFNLRGNEWVEWAFSCFSEHLRVCRGLVAWVVEAPTKQFQYSPSVMRLACRLHDEGYKLRKPPIYKRNGIPGSGGPDWLRNDWEWILCATNDGRLPWSDNTAMCHEPRYPLGGAMSNRTADGQRRNAKTGKPLSQRRPLPKRANPGNVIDCGAVGGGQMGHRMAHDNEAPFPLALAEFFVRSFCPPGGTVLDPFCGSGTTGHAAALHGRNAVLTDIRQSQLDLSHRRIADAMGDAVEFV